MQLSKGNLSKLPTKSHDFQRKNDKLNNSNNNNQKLLIQNQEHHRKSDGLSSRYNSSRYGETQQQKGFLNQSLGIKNSYNNNMILNNKTIQYVSNADPIEILPSEIIFKDIQIN